MSKIIDLQYKESKDGKLIPFDKNTKNIPFKIRRIFYTYDIEPMSKRGGHSHKIVEELVIAIHGSCKVELENRSEKNIYILDSPDKGLYIPPLHWINLYDFDNCILLVLCSDEYNIEESVSNYEEFKNNHK